jgi:hypothetical protein
MWHPNAIPIKELKNNLRYGAKYFWWRIPWVNLYPREFLKLYSEVAQISIPYKICRGQKDQNKICDFTDFYKFSCFAHEEWAGVESKNEIRSSRLPFIKSRSNTSDNTGICRITAFFKATWKLLSWLKFKHSKNGSKWSYRLAAFKW